MRNTYWLVVVCYLYLMPCSVIAQVQQTVLVLRATQQDSVFALAPHAQVYLGARPEARLTDILAPGIQSRFLPLDILKVPVSARAFWLKVVIDNQTQHPMRVGLQLGYFEQANIYLLHKRDTTYLTQRRFKRFEDIEYFDLPPNQNVLYVQVLRTQAIYMAELHEALSVTALHGSQYVYFWEAQQQALRYFTIAFLGALSMMFFYNLILWGILRDRSYLYCVISLFFFGLADFTERGLYEDLVYPQAPTYFLWIILLSISAYTFCQILFTQRFLNLARFMPIAYRWTWVLQGLVAVLLLMIVLEQYQYFLTYLTVCAGIVNISILIISILALRRVPNNITYYLIGNIIYNIGVIIYVLDLFKLIPSNAFTVNGMLMGYLLEMGLFSLALANKINDAKRALVEQQLQREQEKQAIIQEKNKELEAKVQQRTFELQESNEELQQTLKTIEMQAQELAKSNLTKDRLFSIIAHDLRSPLGALEGTLSLMDIDLLSTDELKLITSDLRKRLNALDTTLMDLLQWAKSQMSTAASINPENIALYPLVSGKFELLEALAQRKNIALHNEIPTETMVYADLNQVRAVIRNLIANAIKFTPNGGNITVSASPQSQQQVLIAVRDTGVGMTEAQIAKLFGNYTHFTTKGTADEKGTGFGLLLCKDFVNQNGGEIWVESQPDVGSTFYFTLPIPIS